MARIHARSMPPARPWTEAEISGLLGAPDCFAVTEGTGFALGRVILDEAELLTIAVDPDQRRRGTGRMLLAAFEAEATRRGGTTAFLEVAADNTPALALYSTQGWRESGRRKGYYARANAPAVDALILSKAIQHADAPLTGRKT